MTAAKGLDVYSRLHGCSGQASDAVSAYTQVKKERRTRTSSSFGRELSKDLDQSAESKTTTTLRDSIDDPVVPLERNLYGHPLAGLLMCRKYEKTIVEEGWRGEVSGWQCLYLHRTNHCFLVSVCKRQKDGRENSEHAKDVCEIAKASRFGRPCIVHWWSIFWMYSTSSTCQERNCDGKRENCPRSWSAQEQSPKYITAWSHDMEGHARKCIERCCELSRKTIAQQSFHIVFGRSPPETRRSGNCCRISRDLVSGSIDMLVFSKNWKTRSTLDSW